MTGHASTSHAATITVSEPGTGFSMEMTPGEYVHWADLRIRDWEAADAYLLTLLVSGPGRFLDTETSEVA